MDGKTVRTEAAGDEIRKLLHLFRQGSIGEDDVMVRLQDLGRAGPEVTAGAVPEETEARAQKLALIDILDGYRAAEASGASTLTTWARLCGDEALAGGLRTMAAREAYHAELLDNRLRELGGEPRAQIPAWLREYNARMSDPAATDLERLEAIVGQFPDIETALAPLERAIEAIKDDPLTRELLRTIEQDERATLEWFHSAYATRSLSDS